VGTISEPTAKWKAGNWNTKVEILSFASQPAKGFTGRIWCDFGKSHMN
jgi:hypothetical protein